MRVKDAPAVAAQPAMVVLLNDVEVPGHRSVCAPWCRPQVVPKVPCDLLTVTLGEHHEVLAEADPPNRIPDKALRPTMTEGCVQRILDRRRHVRRWAEGFVGGPARRG
jgi:hypothetical protein